MRNWLTYQEVYEALPAAGFACPCDLAVVLHAREGNVFGACEKLFAVGAAGRSNDFRYYRIAGADVPEGRVPAWFTGTMETKRSDAVGNLGVEGGGFSARRSPPPLKLYGEDPSRPRVPLGVVQRLAHVTEGMAKAHAARDIDLAQKSCGDTPEILSIAAEAHELAAEMLRARVKRLRMVASPVAAE